MLVRSLARSSPLVLVPVKKLLRPSKKLPELPGTEYRICSCSNPALYNAPTACSAIDRPVKTPTTGEDGVTAMCLLLSRGNEHCYGLLTFMSMQSYHVIGHKKGYMGELNFVKARFN